MIIIIMTVIIIIIISHDNFLVKLMIMSYDKVTECNVQ